MSIKHDALEFRRCGAIRYDLFRERILNEKGVDVQLAVDLLKLQNIYDIAVIVSGDQDYISAVRTIKDLGKRVVNVSFRRKDGKILPGGAWRLNKTTDDVIEIKYDELKPFMNFPSE